jgi:CheY-like chemotaxis protein
MQQENMTIIVADDDPDDRLLLGEVLKECHPAIKADFVEDGEALMNYLQARIGDGLPKLILLDVRLPKKDGFDVLREVKTSKDLSHIPVIVLTSYYLETCVESCYKLGANTVIQKPESFDKLVEITNTIVNYWFRTAQSPNRS